MSAFLCSFLFVVVVVGVAVVVFVASTTSSLKDPFDGVQIFG